MAELKSYLKMGLQGGTGTGKSTTAALELLGLSVTYHGKAPVLVRDSEPGWHFLKPLFEAEGVALIIAPGRDFKGLQESLKRAVKEGCCGFCVDSLTHPWGELLERFADSTGRVPFHKFNQIKPMWNDWTVDFLDAPLHAIACGRLGFDYEYEIAEDGKKELIKGDSKMKAGGGESFGYEPHITCEMYRSQKREAGRLAGVEYIAQVLKDRSRALNGQEFTFQDIRVYKPGMFKAVFEAFSPHMKALSSITGVSLGKQNSAEIIPQGDADFHRKLKLKTAALEDWDGTMELCFPGQTANNKRARLIVGETITGVVSRTKFEAYSLDQIQQCVGVLMALRQRLNADAWTTDDQLRKIIDAAREDYRAGTPLPTMLEMQLRQSVEQVAPSSPEAVFEAPAVEPSEGATDPPKSAINAAQLKRLVTIQGLVGMSDTTIKKFLKDTYGITSRKNIPAKDYDAVVAYVDPDHTYTAADEWQ
jgi:hypothetical protein